MASEAVCRSRWSLDSTISEEVLGGPASVMNDRCQAYTNCIKSLMQWAPRFRHTMKYAMKWVWTRGSRVAPRRSCWGRTRSPFLAWAANVENALDSFILADDMGLDKIVYLLLVLWDGSISRWTWLGTSKRLEPNCLLPILMTSRVSASTGRGRRSIK